MKFAYVTAPDYVSKELLKLKGETFKETPLTIEKAKKRPNSPLKPTKKTRSSIIIDHHSENQTTFQNQRTCQNILAIVLGKQTYRNATIKKNQNFQPNV